MERDLRWVGAPGLVLWTWWFVVRPHRQPIIVGPAECAHAFGHEIPAAVLIGLLLMVVAGGFVFFERDWNGRRLIAAAMAVLTLGMALAAPAWIEDEIFGASDDETVSCAEFERGAASMSEEYRAEIEEEVQRSDYNFSRSLLWLCIFGLLIVPVEARGRQAPKRSSSVTAWNTIGLIGCGLSVLFFGLLVHEAAKDVRDGDGQSYIPLVGTLAVLTIISCVGLSRRNALRESGRTASAIAVGLAFAQVSFVWQARESHGTAVIQTDDSQTFEVPPRVQWRPGEADIYDALSLLYLCLIVLCLSVWAAGLLLDRRRNHPLPVERDRPQHDDRP